MPSFHLSSTVLTGAARWDISPLSQPNSPIFPALLSYVFAALLFSEKYNCTMTTRYSYYLTIYKIGTVLSYYLKEGRLFCTIYIYKKVQTRTEYYLRDSLVEF